MKNSILLLLLSLLFVNCKTENTIEGLWIVESVKSGEHEVTPNARWMKFNNDFTQTSGNGWFQHSVGTWNLNKDTNELSMINTNGIKDTNEPFVITIDGEKMTWNRTEDGQPLTVSLKRTDKLPTTYGDQVLGLWKLNNSTGKGNFFENNNGVLFLKWDRRFSIRSSLGRFSGVYNVHGHKSEIELIPYGKDLKRSFWKVDFKENQIDLTLLNSDSTVTRSFVRIHEFPN
ncbi:hypothetical protein [Tenacibaculum sp. 190524A05c]|uniref:Lipocalin-like protein n=1 Tax=Tenacibaculum platacis TaxID=3137852 RepID=A0ABM9P3N1_9FLAO